MKTRFSLAALIVAVVAGLVLGGSPALAQTTGGSNPGSTTGHGAPAPNGHGEEIDLPLVEKDPNVEGDDMNPPVEDEEPPNEDDPPKLYDEELPTKTDSIIYVIDISGSMGWDTQSYVGLDGNMTTGNRLDRAKVEVAKSINGLTRDFEFNVFAYDCSTRTWSPSKQPAEPGPKASAIAWTYRLQPTGATGTGPAVAAALQDKNNFAVVLLTDGAPNCGANSAQGHRQMIQRANTQGAVIHVFGISPDTADMRRFCQNVAQDSGGRYVEVR